MKISVIVPVYNVEKYLEACLDSLIHQLFQDEYEVICVNDGSLDQSDKILKKYEKAYSFINVITQENKGLSGARNTGIRHAKGQYIMFVDSDDFIKENTLDLLFKEAQQNDLEIVMANFVFYYEDKKRNHVLERHELIKNKVIEGEVLLDLDHYHMYACNKLYKRDFIMENKLFFTEGILYEDFEFTPRAYYFAKRVKYLDEVTYYYRQHEESITSQNSIATRNTIPVKDIFVIVDQLRAFNEHRHSKAVLNIELKLLTETIISHLNDMPNKASCKKELKERKVLYRFFESDKLDFKVCGLMYFLGIPGAIKIKPITVKALQKILSKEHISLLRQLKRKLIS